jgi:hypothetical protein
MGSVLRGLYGPQMVIFGFAFNQGAFQAVELQKSLHDWTVPPAPAGSLDATLAATGIPLLALDLRSIPKEGAVADWWKQAHQTRSIGAVYSETQATNYFMNQTSPKAYDVLLFVEKTTAARGNRGGNGMLPVLADREYHDTAANLHFSLPEGWSMRKAAPFGDHETSVPLVLADSKSSPALWYKVLSAPTESTPRADADSEVKQRVNAGLGDYHLRPDSFRETQIGGRTAYTYVGEYKQDGRDMVEYFIRFYGGKTFTMFFAKLPAEDLEAFRPKFEALAATLKM